MTIFEIWQNLYLTTLWLCSLLEDIAFQYWYVVATLFLISFFRWRNTTLNVLKVVGPGYLVYSLCMEEQYVALAFLILFGFSTKRFLDSKRVNKS